MEPEIKVEQAAGVALVHANQARESLAPGGKFVVEHWREGKRINEFHFPNGITNEGKNKLLNVMFYGGTQVSSWYLGLIDSAGYSALGATDDYADINQTLDQWKENANYTDGNNANNANTRPAWGPGAASGQAVTNSDSRGVQHYRGRHGQGHLRGRRHLRGPDQERP